MLLNADSTSFSTPFIFFFFKIAWLGIEPGLDVSLVLALLESSRVEASLIAEADNTFCLDEVNKVCEVLILDVDCFFESLVFSFSFDEKEDGIWQEKTTLGDAVYDVTYLNKNKT